MPRDDSLTPRDLIEKLDVLRVECAKCGRSGGYRVLKLADIHIFFRAYVALLGWAVQGRARAVATGPMHGLLKKASLRIDRPLVCKCRKRPPMDLRRPPGEIRDRRLGVAGRPERAAALPAL
jgi:hypothetical protein